MDIGNKMSLCISLSRGSTTEVLNRGLDTFVIEANIIWRKREGCRWGGGGVNHGGDLYSGGEHLGVSFEILADSVRVFHVARHGNILVPT